MNIKLFRIYYIIGILIIAISSVKSEDDSQGYFIEESSGTITIDGFDLPSGATYNLFKGTFQFKNNLGNYGTVKCKGLVDKKINNFALNILCEGIDKNGFKIYYLLERKGDDMSAGVGKSIIVEATGYNKILIGTECIYATTYIGKTSWTDTKCYNDKSNLEAYKKALAEYQ